MTDEWEKVSEGLECCLSGKHPIPCDKCRYFNDTAYNDVWSCRLSLMRDARELLKAQEPVEPDVDVDTWICGNCGHKLEHQEMVGNNILLHELYSYCPNCGRAVKYDEAD